MNEELPPVKEGDIIDAEIVSLGTKGDGVVKINKFIIMVPDTEIGDKVKVKINRVIRNMAFGETVE